LGSGLARPLVAIALFEFGNCATTLLILRATGLLHHGGRSLVSATSLAIVLYAANNLLGAIVALGGGRWIDRLLHRGVGGDHRVAWILGRVERRDRRLDR
jgi:hypothetical protein